MTEAAARRMTWEEAVKSHGDLLADLTRAVCLNDGDEAEALAVKLSQRFGYLLRERDHAEVNLRRVRDAIYDHQKAVYEADGTSTRQYDRDLWRAANWLAFTPFGADA